MKRYAAVITILSLFLPTAIPHPNDALPFGRPIDQLTTQPLTIIVDDRLRDQKSGSAILQRIAALEGHLTHRAFYLLGLQATVRQRQAQRFSQSPPLSSHLVFIGLPEMHPLLLDQLSRFPVGLFPRAIRIGSRTHRGKDLAFLLRAPQIDEPKRDILVLAGTSPAAILANLDRLLDLPQEDYRLLRGREILEADALSAMGWPRADPIWKRHDVGALRFRVPEGSSISEALMARRETAVETVARRLARYEISLPSRPIVYQLYETARKLEERVGAPEVVFLDPVTKVLHFALGSEDWNRELQALATLLLWRAWGRSYIPLLDEGLPLALLGSYEGVPLHQWASALREIGRLPSAEAITANNVYQLPPREILLPSQGSLLLSLLHRHGLEPLRQLYLRADAKTLRDELRILEPSTKNWELWWETELEAHSIGHRSNQIRLHRHAIDPRHQLITEALGMRADERAEELARELLSDQPRSGFAHSALAELAHRRGNSDETIHQTQLGLASGADTKTLATLHLAFGRALAMTGERARAEIELSLAQSLSDDANLQAMVEFWLDQIEMEGKPPRVLVDQAMEHAASGRMEQAVAEIERLLGRDPLNREGHLALNYLYGKIGRASPTLGNVGPIGVPSAMISEAEILYRLAETPRERKEALFLLERGWRSAVVDETDAIHGMFQVKDCGVCGPAGHLAKAYAQRWKFLYAIVGENAGQTDDSQRTEAMKQRIIQCRDAAKAFRALACRCAVEICPLRPCACEICESTKFFFRNTIVPCAAF